MPDSIEASTTKWKRQHTLQTFWLQVDLIRITRMRDELELWFSSCACFGSMLYARYMLMLFVVTALLCAAPEVISTLTRGADAGALLCWNSSQRLEKLQTHIMVTAACTSPLAKLAGCNKMTPNICGKSVCTSLNTLLPRANLYA